jgi:hypothetical protein
MNTIGSPTYELSKYVVRFPKSLVWKIDAFIKDSRDFVSLIKNERNSQDTLVNFDVVVLFTKIPLDEAIQVINQVANLGMSRLAEAYLYSTFFSFQGEFSEQNISVDMGFSLSLIVENLFVDHFERKALKYC